MRISKAFQKIICLSLFFCSFIHLVSSHGLKRTFENTAGTNLVSSEIYLNVIDELTDHLNGDVVLTDADFENNDALLAQNIFILSTDKEAITKSFDLLNLFETSVGALFTTNNTRNGFNRAYTSDGLNLHRNIIRIQQGLMDYAYNDALLQESEVLLDGKFFRTSEYFPGSVDAPENAEVVENATIKCSYLLAIGSQPWANIGNANVVRPTGCYLAPGSIAEITVPEALVGKGIKIRVGAHYWNLENKSRYKRMDRVSLLFDVNEVSTKIANPLGGGVYLEIPLGIDEGLVNIELKNVVRSPFFSIKTFHETTLTEWMEVERNRAAPWTDFETDKFMVQVPTSWIYAFDDPKTLLENWDKSMDVVSDLLGRPRVTDRHKNYLQFDVIIRGSAYHPGYPMSNTPYDPNASTDGLPKHNILKGPQYDQDIHFHELGHEVAITKFAGETEAIVNFLYVPVLNKCFDYSLEEAFQQSFGPSYNYTSTKDNTTRTRLVADTFHEGLRRNTCSCTKNEVRYQHRGYAHYVDIVELYGWEALEKFWKSESDAAAMGNPFPVNDQPQDDRILRMSKAAGVDLRPLFHFWGIHPDEPEVLAQQMEDNNLELPMDIKAKLHQYRTLIPSNYEEFVAFGNELYPNFLNYSGDQFDFGAGWYQLTAQTYDETKAAAITQALSDIIILYYGTDCFEVDDFLIPDFNLNESYCKSDNMLVLPTISNNGINGQWSVPEIDASEVGIFEYVFTPELDQCAEVFSLEVVINSTSADIIGETEICHGENTTLNTEEAYVSYSWQMDGQVLGNAQEVMVAQGGFLNLLAVDANGCLIEGEVLITENEVIDIAIEVAQPACHGDSGSAVFVPLGETGAEYIYSLEGETLNAGTYTVTVTDNSGCSESFEFEVVEPAPLVIELDQDEIVVSGGTAPYTIMIDTVAEVQQVTVVDGNGCEATADFVITGIYDDIVKSIAIFPNPTSAALYLQMEEDAKIISIQLVSIDGQLLKQYESHASILDVSEVENGVHLLQIRFEGGNVVHQRVIVLR